VRGRCDSEFFASESSQTCALTLATGSMALRQCGPSHRLASSILRQPSARCNLVPNLVLDWSETTPDNVRLETYLWL
jgi:hypothetical protein